MEQGETVELAASIFGKPLRRDILHRCVVWFLANLRQVRLILHHQSSSR